MTPLGLFPINQTKKSTYLLKCQKVKFVIHMKVPEPGPQVLTMVRMHIIFSSPHEYSHFMFEETEEAQKVSDLLKSS